MALSLSTIAPKKGATKKKKRLGRGNASRGTYSGRGLKGQKARSGVSGLKRLGLKNVLRTIPKKRGFKSVRGQAVSVRLSVLDKYGDENTVITPKRMVSLGLITKKEAKKIKVVGNDKVKKKLQVKAHAFSESASTAILKSGGKALLIQK
jgi:large subunit ribosomal protein L15